MENRKKALIIMLFGGFVAMLIGLALAGGHFPSQVSWSKFAVAIAVVAGIVLFVTVLAVRASRTRTAAWRERADAVGDAIDLDFDHEPTKEFHKDYLFLPEIKKSGKTNRVARGTIAGREALFFEHSYVVSTGQSSHTVYHCVYSTDAPKWPELSVTPRNPISKLFRKLGIRRGMLLDDPRFNQAFVVRSEDEPFAVTLLTPMMQAFMLEKPNARWRISNGRVFLIYRGSLKLDRMPATVDRLARFWSFVPPEVSAWERRGIV
ncbi:MAG: hypothetical protein H6813_06530 [Phycisphaeraceae bacterium]|nr:hypothetical protein [Phycisphaeraceae bacterium]MCB9848128.1 hypothetical protein [Phycisphaeraceae bacterium]